MTNEEVAKALGWTEIDPKGFGRRPDNLWQILPNWVGDPTTIIREIEGRGLGWKYDSESLGGKGLGIVFHKASGDSAQALGPCAAALSAALVKLLEGK